MRLQIYLINSLMKFKLKKCLIVIKKNSCTSKLQIQELMKPQLLLFLKLDNFSQLSQLHL